MRNGPIHTLLDTNYGPDGEAHLAVWLSAPADLNLRAGPLLETPLHVATRRRRLRAVQLIADAGADLDAQTVGGKTAFAHAIRRGFAAIAQDLEQRGARTSLTEADRLAVALTSGDLRAAQGMLRTNPRLAHTGNPEEDRLLADLAGRTRLEPVALLVSAGANVAAPGLDGGSPLHQAAWFGQPHNLRLLLDAGAPVNLRDSTHRTSALGWALHGAKHAGGAASSRAAYQSIVRMLLEAGAEARLAGPHVEVNAAIHALFLGDESSNAQPHG